jgi:hypothetical protein
VPSPPARHSALVTSFAEASLADLDRQIGALEESRARVNDLLRRVGISAELPPQLRAQVLTASGRLAVVEGDLPLAAAHLGEALELASGVGDRPVMALVADALAEVAAAAGDAPRAARVLGLAAATRGAADGGSPDVSRTRSAARKALGVRFDGIYAEAAGLDAAAASEALKSQDF